MKQALVIAYLLLALVGCQRAPTSVEVFFSPKGGCTEAIVRELGKAKKSVYIQAYSFTSAPIAEATVQCLKRHVSVQALLDKSQRTEKYSSLTYLLNSGVPTHIDGKHAIAHNKIIIDEEVILTGSFNFTNQAERSNAENLLVIHDKALAARYISNWKLHASHSE